MKVVITGANGFVGRALLRRLVDGAASPLATMPAGVVDTVAVVRSTSSAEELRADFPHVRVEVVKDTRTDALQEVLIGTDAVVHLAWSSVPVSANLDPLADLDANVTGGLRLLEACGRAGIGRFIFISSGGTLYGAGHARVPHTEHAPVEVMGAYGAGKYCMEEYVRLRAAHHGFDHIILRPGNIYGRVDGRPREQGVIEQWMDRLLSGDAIDVWNGLDVVRDYVHIDDMVDALVAALVGGSGPRSLNVGTGHGTSLKELSELLMRVTGRSVAFQVKGNTPPAISWNVLDPGLLMKTWGLRPAICSEERIKALWEARMATRKGF